MIGTFNSLASDFTEREISDSSEARLSPSRAAHQLQVVDHDQTEPAALACQATRTGAQVDRVEAGVSSM